MNRRRFLGLTVAGAAALVLDPERLLWVPGKKFVFLQAPPIHRPTLGELVAATYDKVRQQRMKDGNYFIWPNDELLHRFAEESYDELSVVRL